MVMWTFLQRFIIARQLNPSPILQSVYRTTGLNRNFSADNILTDGEKHIEQVLRENLDVADVQINDISGGCGAMYEVYVSSNDFKGKRMVQQHRLVTEILKKEVKEMHGLRILTSIPDVE